jgi:MOSC domain
MTARRTGVTMSANVVAVSRSPTHSFSKTNELGVLLVAGRGVDGDAHAGETVKHRSRVARDSRQPNLRQVHLIHRELFEELAVKGYAIAPGELGENITTQGLDLLGLPFGTRLRLGAAVVQVTGLRNPCTQLDRFAPGLMHAVLERDANGQLVRKAGIMAVVIAGGMVCPGDRIAIELPAQPHVALEPV